MKDAVSHKSPKVMSVPNAVLAVFSVLTISRKKLQFSLLNAQDTVKISEFEVTHRDLYTPADRLPVQNGVLDRRLVSNQNPTHFDLQFTQTRGQQTKTRSARHAASRTSTVSAIMPTSSLSSQFSTSATSNTSSQYSKLSVK
jgi:hypothetical protein